MNYTIAIVVVALVVLLWRILSKGNLKFWRAVARRPDESYEYFISHPEVWFVADTPGVKDFLGEFRKLNPNWEREWTGPFRLYVPKIERFVHIFGKVNQYEEEQKRILDSLNKI